VPIQEKPLNSAISLPVHLLQIDSSNLAVVWLTMEAMDLIEGLIYLTSVYPLGRAWLANRNTTLVYTLSWVLAAWTAWAGVVFAASGPASTTARYVALCLTGCAGIGVLGARRPIAAAWNFVLLGLLAVLLLPLGEQALLGTPLLDPLRLTFVSGTLVVSVLNYLPTRLGIPILLLGAAATAELLLLTETANNAELQPFLEHAGRWLMPAACWWGLVASRRRWLGVARFDREWLTFRDRFGLLWAQRVREQFNRAAANACWPVHLRWSGLRRTARGVTITKEQQTMILETLRGMLKRFGSETPKTEG
jgi:hypothetical protein